MKLILETTNTKYYLTTSRKYYHTDRDEELIVLKHTMGCLPDWVYTLSCAERLGIVQYDVEGNRIVVGNNYTMNPFHFTKITNRF